MDLWWSCSGPTGLTNILFYTFVSWSIFVLIPHTLYYLPLRNSSTIKTKTNAGKQQEHITKCRFPMCCFKWVLSLIPKGKSVVNHGELPGIWGKRHHNCCLALARTSHKVHTQLNVDTYPSWRQTSQCFLVQQTAFEGRAWLKFSYNINLPQTWRLMDLRSLLNVWRVALLF